MVTNRCVLHESPVPSRDEEYATVDLSKYDNTQ